MTDLPIQLGFIKAFKHYKTTYFQQPLNMDQTFKGPKITCKFSTALFHPICLVMQNTPLPIILPIAATTSNPFFFLPP